MSTTWHCLNPTCDECGTDPSWAATDKAAERHTKTTGHGRSTQTVGSRRVRDGELVRNVRGGAVDGT